MEILMAGHMSISKQGINYIMNHMKPPLDICMVTFHLQFRLRGLHIYFRVDWMETMLITFSN